MLDVYTITCIHQFSTSKYYNRFKLIKIMFCTVAVPGFPTGGANLRHGHFLAETYVKTKELGPGGAGDTPMDPPMLYTYDTTITTKSSGDVNLNGRYTN